MKISRRIYSLIVLTLFWSATALLAQNDGHDHSGHNHNHDHSGQDHSHDHGHHEGDHPKDGHHDAHHAGPYDPGATAFHHIADHNVYSVGPWNFPLPLILYDRTDGSVDMFSSGKFDIGHHGTGHNAIDGYVLYEGVVHRIKDNSFPAGEHHIDHFDHKTIQVKGKDKEVPTVVVNGRTYDLDKKSTLDGGFLGGGMTSFIDFSPTKNVVTMLVVCLFLGWVFIGMAGAYKRREGQAPKGVQGFLEPIIVFLRDEVAIPFIGKKKYMKFFPFLLAVFFFILGLNLFGQIPFLGSSNVTGNLAVTMALAIFAFLITNLNGNGHYWEHTLWMPGVPAPVKALVLTPVEFLGLFIKPLTLMLRLFANITAGHMVILTFVGLIFIFGNSGESAAGTGLGIGLAVPLTLFMMAIELLVAFIQAFVFTILTASYIGAAVEEPHHH